MTRTTEIKFKALTYVAAFAEVEALKGKLKSAELSLNAKARELGEAIGETNLPVLLQSPLGLVAISIDGNWYEDPHPSRSIEVSFLQTLEELESDIAAVDKFIEGLNEVSAAFPVQKKATDA